VKLLLEEYEAINLADYQKLSQEMAAEKMGVSRPTFSRIYESARGKIALAFMEVLPIIIEGGNIEANEDWLHCPTCHTIFKITDAAIQSSTCPVCKSEKTEKINTPESVVVKSLNSLNDSRCICPKCNFVSPHQPGQPCRSVYCPSCGISMIRENSPHHKQLKRRLKQN
jgi:uncharacterized paraquat-inducible protein A